MVTTTTTIIAVHHSLTAGLGGSILKPLVHVFGSLLPLLKSLFEVAALAGTAIVARFWFKLRRGPNAR